MSILFRRARKYAGFLLHPVAAKLVQRAHAVRQDGQYHAAAILYEEASRSSPRQAWIHIQAGHMFKEAGDYARAERHYLQALERMPRDEDLALQLGHFYKLAGRLEDAEGQYTRALKLRPGWAEPEEELAQLSLKLGTSRATGEEPAGDDLLVPELMPRPGASPPPPAAGAIQIRRLGRMERGPRGTIRTLRGVEAVRGFCVSATPIQEVQVALDGKVILRGSPKGGYPLPPGTGSEGVQKYVFNLWHDFSNLAEGYRALELRCIDARGGTRALRAPVLVAGALADLRNQASDGFVPGDPDDPRPLDTQINSRPSTVRPATRSLLAEPPRTVLVQRIDQLGDMVVSVPAIRRLREILPEARLIGLLSSANAPLARTLGLFDDIVVADLPEDEGARRRVMSRDAQQKLRSALAPFRIELAIDLSASDASRPLLLLSGAPMLYGFATRDNPWLTAGVESFSHDAVNGHEAMPHSARIMGLVEWLGTMLASHARPAPRPELSRDMLAPYGIAPDDRYILLHTGARLAFSRWHGFADLAAMILDRTDLKVVMMGEDAAAGANLPPSLTGSGRFRLVHGQLPFDHFDALLSLSAVMVGNDSGPKHLAALRGTKVVSLHMARINWGEWAQEGDGLVVSRRVPCAGCGIHYEPEECGKDFACIANISVEEVFAAVSRLL